MSTTDAPDEGPAPETEAAPTVRCDACGSSVTVTATDIVPRRYMSIIVNETWCNLCIKTKDEATDRALQVGQADTAPDY